MSGRRLVVWVPEEDLWIFEALAKLRLRYDQQGVPISQSGLSVQLLKEKLEKWRPSCGTED
jgi:hypothetical protein